MAMRMPPAVARQSVLPQLNRSSLVFFGGLVLIVVNFAWVNNPGNLVNNVFHQGTNEPIYGVSDVLWQLVGVGILTLAAQYMGDNAATAALLFIGALWLLWLVVHFGQAPAKKTVGPVATKLPEAHPPVNE